MNVKPEEAGVTPAENTAKEEKRVKKQKKPSNVKTDKVDNHEAETPSFEEAIEQLEETVRLLEEGKTSLDRSMELYEKGVRLIRLCKGQLEGAEQKIKLLGGSGEPDGTGDSNTEKEF